MVPMQLFVAPRSVTKKKEREVVASSLKSAITVACRKLEAKKCEQANAAK